ncbi:AAA family ATPase [candidate division KSB1 bacterium]|nr:AAA family ATPase [candidate division KSB1 bacterium]
MIKTIPQLVLLLSILFFFTCAGRQKNSIELQPVEAPEWATVNNIPQPQRDRIIEIVNTAGNRESRIAEGKGLTILMTEPGGTNKLFAAKVIANRSGMPLYRIDLSSVVSKYIGETEKNLKKIFSQIENQDVILFFDEADALFGRRTDVNDSNDRYANQDTNYLLQRIENYEGIVILASNYRQNEAPERLIKICNFVINIPD